MKLRFSTTIASLALVVLATACTGTSSALQSAVAQTAMSSSSSLTTLTDVDAAAVAHAIDDGEIQMAQLAVTSASSQQVRDFAQMMITDHQNANRTLESNGFGVVRNPVVDALNAEVSRQMTMLRGKSGADFDRAYMGSQVMMHQTALDLMRSTLVPSAQSTTLRQTLTTMRDTVQMHLDHARAMK